jgi:hypothetical protein
LYLILKGPKAQSFEREKEREELPAEVLAVAGEHQLDAGGLKEVMDG